MQETLRQWTGAVSGVAAATAVPAWWLWLGGADLGGLPPAGVLAFALVASAATFALAWVRMAGGWGAALLTLAALALLITLSGLAPDPSGPFAAGLLPLLPAVVAMRCLAASLPALRGAAARPLALCRAPRAS